MWANEPKMARKWTDEHGSTPVKAKVGKYQEFKHPQHDILPLEHMEEKVSSKERVERLLDERKKKKESKKKTSQRWTRLCSRLGNRIYLLKQQKASWLDKKLKATGAAIKALNTIP